MKKHIISSLIVTATIGSTTLHAESLYEVYKLAIQTDAELKAAAENYKAKNEEVRVKEGDRYPSISMSANLGYAKDATPSYNYGTGSGGVSFDFNYPLYSAALNYNLDGAKLEYKSAGIDFENAKEDLSLTVLTAYFTLLMKQSTLSTTIEQVKSNKSELDQVQKQYDVGLVSITDLEDAQAEYDAVKVTELTDRSAVAYAQKVLRRYTKRVIKEIPELAKDYPIVMDSETTVESLIETAVKNNKELHILDVAVESAENNIKLKEASGRSPVLSLVASVSHSNYNYSDYGNLLSAGTGSYDEASVGFAFNMPLYSGGSINASVRSASASAEASRETRDDALENIELSIRSLMLNLQTSVAQVKAQQVLIKSRESALDASKAGYEVGTRNLVELLAAQSNLFEAINAYHQYRYNFVLQQLQLLEVTGTLSEEKIKELDKWLVARN